MTTTELLLRASVDQGAAAQSVKALRDIQAASDATRDSLLAINKDAGNVSGEFQRLEQISQTIGRDASIRDLAAQFVELGRISGDYEVQLEHMVRALREVGASSGEIRKATVEFIDLEKQAQKAAKSSKGIGLGSLRSASSAFRGLGLDEAADATARVADVGQLVKELGDAGKAMGLVGTASAVAGTEATAAAGGVTALSAALSPMLLVLIPVAAAVLAVKLVLDDMERSATKAVEAEKKRFAEQQKQLDFKNANIEKARTTSPEQNIQSQRDLEQKIANTTDLITQKVAEREANKQKYEDLGGSLNPGKRNELGAAGLEIQAEIDKLVADRQKLIDDYKNEGVALAEDVAKHQAEVKAINDLLQAAEDLSAKRQEENALLHLTSDAAKDRLDQLKADQHGLEEARKKLADSGNTSKEVTDQIREYDKALKDNAQAQKYLTETAMSLIKAREAEEKAIKDAEDALKSFQDSMKQLQAISKEIDKMETDHTKQLQRQAEDDARQAERRGVEEDYRQRIAAAKREEAEQAVRNKLQAENEAADIKANDERAKIDQDYFARELKAYDDYLEAEKRATARADLQRLQTLERAQLDLRTLAAKGDVAGFVTRSNQAKLELKEQAATANLAAQERQADYEKAVQEARDARQKQLDDLGASLEKERQAREAAAEQRVAEIEAQGQEANTRSAQLEQELNDLREQWRIDDLNRQRDLEQESYEERLQIQKDKQQEIMGETTRFFDEWLDYVINSSNTAAAARSSEGGDQQFFVDSPLPDDGGSNSNHSPIDVNNFRFATGLDYVPYDDFPALLHEGERVLTKQQNMGLSYGGGSRRGGGNTYQITVQNTVGDIATKSMLDEYQEVTIAGIEQSLEESEGRGNA